MPRPKRKSTLLAVPQRGWALYLRTSSDENQKPEMSRARQRFAIEKNVLDRSEMAVVGEYIDVLTGKTPRREGYQQLLSDARAGKFSHVIVERADRFGRNDTEALRAIDELHEFGVAVRFANSPDLDPMDPDDRILVTLSFTLARRESALLGVRVKGGLQAKRQSGGWCGRAPDGYRNVEERTTHDAKKQFGRFTRRIEIDPERAQMWREAWELLLSDKLTLEEIAEALHAKGYRRQRGGAFVTVLRDGTRRCHVSTLSNTFHNWAYAGWVVSKTNGLMPKTTRGNWEPLVSTEDFEHGVEILDKRIEHRTRKQKHDYLLTGLAYYQRRDGRLVRLTGSTSNSGRPGGGTSYYRLASAGGVSFLCSVIEARVAEEFALIQVNPELIPMIRESFTQELMEQLGMLRPDEGARLRKVLRDVDDEEARTLRLFAAGKVSEDVWHDLWSEWQDRRQQVRRALDTLEFEHDYHIDNLNAALEIISMIQTIYNGLERADQKDLLRQIVERVIVSEDGNVRFVLRSPFAYLRELSDQLQGGRANKPGNGYAKSGRLTTAASCSGCSNSLHVCWGTWIRTKINRSRICSSAVELSPKDCASVSRQCARFKAEIRLCQRQKLRTFRSTGVVIPGCHAYHTHVTRKDRCMPQSSLRKPVVPAALDLLLTRRSINVSQLTDPGPDADELETILRIATRVPDHGKLAPWRIVVIQGDARLTLGDAWAEIYARQNPGALPELVEFERKRLLRAPLILAVHTRIVNLQKIPRWEQILSGAGVCLNALIAANALGYYGTWVSEWVAYDAEAKAALDIPAEDEVVGYVYIGSALTPTEERPRPVLSDVVRYL